MSPHICWGPVLQVSLLDDHKNIVINFLKTQGRVHYYEDNIDYDDGNVEQQCYREKTVNPSIGRRYSLAVPNPRIRSNSIAIYNDDEEDVVFTSYGPVILEPTRNGNEIDINFASCQFNNCSQKGLDARRILGNSQWNFVHSWQLLCQVLHY